MKKVLPLLTLLLLACSCSDEFLNESKGASATVAKPTFSFDSIAAPNVWCQYQSLEEMLEACQIPEDKLKSMSTDELIEVCMSHPLHAIYFAYNNELEGAEIVFKNFNGFAELRRRADAPHKILAFYKDINFNPKAKAVKRKDFTKITYMGFVELYLASKEMPALYQGDNLSALEKISNNVLDKKLNQPVKEIYTIRHSLLINAQIKLAEGSLSAKDETLLKSFVNSGGNASEPQEYTKVSAILSK